MTKRILSVAAVAAVLALFTPLAVTTSASEVNCRIPFSFIVDGTTMPAGTYTLSYTESTLVVRGYDISVAVLTNGVSSWKDTETKAVFEKIGARYELIEVWNGGSGRETVRPRHDRNREAALRIAPVERVVVLGM